MIYLDNAATTLPRAKILDEYKENSILFFANSSSNHKIGLASNIALDNARKDILNTLKLKDHNIIFTSGATESINLSIKGVAANYKNRGKHIISAVNEHPAVLNSLKALEEEGFSVTYLSVNKEGTINLDELKSSLRKDTILVSIMHVNNETGAINPIKEISKILKDYPKVIFHVDATQAIGKLRFDYNDIDLISFSGHKIHAPKNSGALIYKKKITFKPVLSGGGHENNFRSGTVDVAKAIAIASAIKEEYKDLEENNKHVHELFDYLYDYISSRDDVILNSTKDGSPYILNYSLKNRKASVIVEALSNLDIYVSSLSACSSKKNPYSYVIYEMNKDMNLASNALRVSFDASNTLDEIKAFIEAFDTVMRQTHENR